MSEWKKFKNGVKYFNSNVKGHHVYADLNSIIDLIKEGTGDEVFLKESEEMLDTSQGLIRKHTIEVYEGDKLVDKSTLHMPFDAVQNKIHPAQEQGMVITYLRRYNYQLLLGVTDTKDLNDSDNKIVKEVPKPVVLCEVCKKETKTYTSMSTGKNYCDKCVEDAKAKRKEQAETITN